MTMKNKKSSNLPIIEFLPPYELHFSDTDNYEVSKITDPFLKCPGIRTVKLKNGSLYYTRITSEGKTLNLGGYRTHTRAAVAVLTYKIIHYGWIAKAQIEEIDTALQDLRAKKATSVAQGGPLPLEDTDELRKKRRCIFDNWAKEIANNIAYVELFLNLADERGATYESIKRDKPERPTRKVSREYTERKSDYYELYKLGKSKEVKILRSHINDFRQDEEKFLDGLPDREWGTPEEKALQKELDEIFAIPEYLR